MWLVPFFSIYKRKFFEGRKPKEQLTGHFTKVLKSFFDTIVEGYKFITKNKDVLFPLLILLALQSALGIVVVSLPVIAVQILNISVNYSGVSIVVPAGIGALLGAFYVPRLIKQGWRKKTIIESALGLITFSLLTISLGVPLLPVLLRVMATSILIVATGFSFVGINIPALTFLQEATPEWFRGRVFGNLWFLTTLVTILPVLFSGAISQIFGVRTLLTLMAVGTLLALIYSMRRGQDLIEKL